MPRTIVFNRDEVLLKAMVLFTEKGYTACSMRRLVEITGLKPGSLYGAFGDKRSLYLEALRLYEKLSIEQLEAFLPSGESPLGNIRTFFDLAFLNMPSEQLRAGCLFVNTIAEMTDIDPEVAQAAGSCLDRLEAAFKKALERARETGEMDQDKEPEQIARFLTTLVKGLRITVKQTQDSETLNEIINTAFGVIEN